MPELANCLLACFLACLLACFLASSFVRLCENVDIKKPALTASKLMLASGVALWNSPEYPFLTTERWTAEVAEQLVEKGSH